MSLHREFALDHNDPMYVLTVYPFDNNNSAKYEPSWPVIPVINATFDSVDDLSVMVVMKRMVLLLYEREREREREWQKAPTFFVLTKNNTGIKVLHGT